MDYSINHVFALAKRWNNGKRPYLLVNPLQAKHLPVSPADALRMMRSLGQKTVRRFPQTTLVIAFAETATAVGAAVAGCFGDDCVCIQTTRETLPGVSDWLRFREEHSHATEQKLCAESLREWVRSAPQILLVDDELSTGKTVLNIVEQLRTAFPEMNQRKIAVASILNRLGDVHLKRLQAANIQCEWLVKLPHEDLSARVAGFEITAAQTVDGAGRRDWVELLLPAALPDLRRGVKIGPYMQRCAQAAMAAAEMLAPELPKDEALLVLGTEECMYPALALGAALEKDGFSVLCHATTRSPIGICQKEGYPISSGAALRSVYDAGRQTFIYNLKPYANAVVLTDRTGGGPEGVADLVCALKQHGCGRVFLIEGGGYVQHIS